jgi:regulatory protein YycH of two-component signal transduction system YycFG
MLYNTTRIILAHRALRERKKECLRLYSILIPSREKYLNSHGIFHDLHAMGNPARNTSGIPSFYFKPLFLDCQEDFSCNKPVCSWIKNICSAIFCHLFTVLSENVRKNQYNHIFI